MKFFVIVRWVYFLLMSNLMFGCVRDSWLTDSSVDSNHKTPAELIRFLGEPAKVLYKQRRPDRKTYVQEYRYYIVDRDGKVFYRSYIYDGDLWITCSRSGFTGDGLNGFKVIGPHDAAYKYQLDVLRKRFPDERAPAAPIQ